MPVDHLLAIDQGTSSSRAVVFDRRAEPVATAQQEFTQFYPQPGWVEHDPEEIWQSILEVMKKVIANSRVPPEKFAALGITNQRETTLVWERATGKCIYPAIVWQDRRTSAYCRKLVEEGLESLVIENTGLRIDPYFSASKLVWILDNVPDARRQAEAGKLAFGTVDSYLIWRLTGGRAHVTDATNASRTMLFNIHSQQWDAELLKALAVPESLLPEVRDCADDFGVTDESLTGVALPIAGVAGDQQAALVGQAGFSPGMSKSTYGTGCFVITNTGKEVVRSQYKLLSTVAYRLKGEVTYGVEGSIFVAGSAIQWLRDELKVIRSAAETEAIAVANGVVEHVHVVPAFAGLGAPYWDPDARGAILGLSRDCGISEIVTAALQAVAFQTKDLVNAMTDDGIGPSVVRVDGGMVVNDWLLQFMADILGLTVERPKNIESTVLGAALLAGLQAGVFPSVDALSRLWQRDAVFHPQMDDERRNRLYADWVAAVARVRT
ncbi:MAG TPA: glycerol kinase GlpK [Woeseiaceae bacterium]|nr:glycerol kinase GlpK [Woeseiaceae bacterium]